jgi:hypothetical protein
MDDSGKEWSREQLLRNYTSQPVQYSIDYLCQFRLALGVHRSAFGVCGWRRARLRTRRRSRPPDFAQSSETPDAAPSFETPGGHVGQAVLEFGLWRVLAPGVVRFEKQSRAVDYRDAFTAWLAFRKHTTADPAALFRGRGRLGARANAERRTPNAERQTPNANRASRPAEASVR